MSPALIVPLVRRAPAVVRRPVFDTVVPRPAGPAPGSRAVSYASRPESRGGRSAPGARPPPEPVGLRRQFASGVRASERR